MTKPGFREARQMTDSLFSNIMWTLTQAFAERSMSLLIYIVITRELYPAGDFLALDHELTRHY